MSSIGSRYPEDSSIFTQIEGIKDYDQLVSVVDRVKSNSLFNDKDKSVYYVGASKPIKVDLIIKELTKKVSALKSDRCKAYLQEHTSELTSKPNASLQSETKIRSDMGINSILDDIKNARFLRDLSDVIRKVDNNPKIDHAQMQVIKRNLTEKVEQMLKQPADLDDEEGKYSVVVKNIELLKGNRQVVDDVIGRIHKAAYLRDLAEIIREVRKGEKFDQSQMQQIKEALSIRAEKMRKQPADLDDEEGQYPVVIQNIDRL